MAEQTPQNDWDIKPELYQKDSQGSFLLKKDGTPKKKAGRPKGESSRGYNFHSDTKAKIAARRSLRDKQKKLTALEAKVRHVRTSVKKQRTVQQKLDSGYQDNVLVEDSDLELLPKATQDVVKDKHVI
ncbi:uncharacterized protein METZ01_LOCUS513799, partial [marine metagenome]